MNYRFQITLKQQLLILVPFLTMNPVIIVIFIFIFRDVKIELWMLVAFFLLFLIEVLSVVILNIQYLLKNWNAVLMVDNVKQSIQYHQKQQFLEYKIHEIERIRYYATSGHISRKGSSLWYTFDPYRFYKITFKDKREIVVTCLMINNIEHVLEELIGVRAEWKFRLFPLIY
jgi:hypothetical protein